AHQPRRRGRTRADPRARPGPHDPDLRLVARATLRAVGAADAGPAAPLAPRTLRTALAPGTRAQHRVGRQPAGLRLRRCVPARAQGDARRPSAAAPPRPELRTRTRRLHRRVYGRSGVARSLEPRLTDHGTVRQDRVLAAARTRRGVPRLARSPGPRIPGARPGSGAPRPAPAQIGRASRRESGELGLP